MSTVEIIAAPADAPEVARKLLEAAGGDHRAVKTGGLSAFYVSTEVATAAGYGAVEETPAAAPAPSAKRGNQKAEQGA